MREAAVRQYRITLSGAVPGIPNEVVLSQASGWAWPDGMAFGAVNAKVVSETGSVPFWFEQATRDRCVLWLRPSQTNEELILRVQRRSSRSYHPHDVGLIGGMNAANQAVLAHRWPAFVCAAGQSYGGGYSYWNMVPKLWLMADGSIGCGWMGGAAREQDAPKVVLFSKSRDGIRWSAPVQIPTPGGTSYAMVSAAWSHNGVDYVVIASGSVYEPKTALHLISSADGGTTWSAPAACTGLANIGTGGNNQTVKLSDGRVAFTVHDMSFRTYLCIASLNAPTEWTQNQICDPAPDLYLQEPAIAELEDGSLLVMFRTRAGFLYRAVGRKTGTGYSFTGPQPTDIPNPDSKCELLRLDSGEVVLACNLAGTAPGTSGERRDLSILVSSDGGRSWKRSCSVEGGTHFAMQYPALLQHGDRVVIACACVSGGTSEDANRRALWATAIPVSDLLTGFEGWSYAGGGLAIDGGHLFRSYQRESCRLNTPLGWEWDGQTPLYIRTVTGVTKGWLRGYALCAGRYMAGETSPWAEYAYVGQDGSGENTWAWEVWHKTGQSTSTIGLPNAGAGGAPQILEMFCASAGFYIRVNGTRFPTSGAFEPVTNAINVVALGHGTAGPWSGPYLRDFELGCRHRTLSAVIVAGAYGQPVASVMAM